MRNFCIYSLCFFSLFCSQAAYSANIERVFFQKMAGQWSGPGEVVAGKYKGIKFNCQFSGAMGVTNISVTLDGSCRTGFFSQNIHVKFIRQHSGYQGSVNDGANAQGLDVVSGQFGKDQIILQLDSQSFKGSLSANLANDNLMHITFMVQVEELLVPVIGMQLTRSTFAKVQGDAS